jgi:hypothetical protein
MGLVASLQTNSTEVIKIFASETVQTALSCTVDCLFVCFPGVTTHCGCIFTAQ